MNVRTLPTDLRRRTAEAIKNDKTRWLAQQYRAGRVAYQVLRLTPDWRRIQEYRRGASDSTLPPLRLRSGLVLQHGPLDDPVLMLDEVFINRWYEIDATPPPGALMVDIGANIGAVSLYWAEKASSLHIHAYEPNPSAGDVLRLNMEVNGTQNRVDVFAEAVGRGQGQLDLWVDVPSALSTGYLDESPADGGRRISVPMVGLDEVWRRLDQRKIWLLKIDTEGAEGDILEGASSGVLEAVDHAIVEYHDNISPGVSSRCRRVLEAAGFECRELVHPWEEGIFYARRS